MTDHPSDKDKSKNHAKKHKRLMAAALKNELENAELPKIIASGHGKWAEKILEMAFSNDIKVREDPELAQILATLELNSEIPTEAITAVAEILAYVYQAEGRKISPKNEQKDT